MQTALELSVSGDNLFSTPKTSQSPSNSDLRYLQHSSAHTADDCPSSYIRLPTLELSSDTPPTAKMNSEDRRWAMEEELMKHRMKSDAIEISLQAIFDKLNILPRTEDVML